MHTRLWWFLAVISLASGTTHAREDGFGNMNDSRTQEAIVLMAAFSERTGITSERQPKRYLWTDAFAVCNLLGLSRLTGDKQFEAQALRLVEQVHHALGRYRDDDPRTGWISGLSEREGEAHPTRGGLRIGKALPERAPNAPFDERLEWDRDGQYFHYLTKWMHALDQVARASKHAQYNRWARQLADTAYAAFSYQPSPGTTPRLYWKMSIDLSRPLVPSMGQHDPLDGYVTAVQLNSTASMLSDTLTEPDLEQAISQFAQITKHSHLATDDPLGLGGLLTDAWRVEQLTRQGAEVDPRLLEALLAATLTGLDYYARSGELQQPVNYRLAFRELGLAIGLHAVERMWQTTKSQAGSPFPATDARGQLQALMQYVPIAKDIESFWRESAHRRTPTWLEHQDINEVMLATSLAPDGYLDLLSPE